MSETDDNAVLHAKVARENIPHNFRIVGIGASAGGLEALELLFKSLPDNTGMAFVVVQHLSPDFKSHMKELLSRYNGMPIYRVENGMEVLPNSIYLIPPKMEMVISGGKLLLTEKSEDRSFSHPIDQFFRSLASDIREFSVGVILSGTGSDGARGIKDIHEVGGLVIAQDEHTAKFDGMPLNAQATGIVDLVLAPQEISQALIQYQQTGIAPDIFSDQGQVTSPLRGIDRVLQLLQSSHGLDFAHYKSTTVRRRIQRRIELKRLDTVEKYIELLEKDPPELNSLYEDLLIGVTHFFRDPEAFEYLEQNVLPKIVENANIDRDIRIWVAGCASGQEAYSMAMIVDEAVRRRGVQLSVKIFATDAHNISLSRAARGIYSKDEISSVPEQRRQTYFVEKADGFHVSPALRRMIVFAPHNVIRNAPFTQMDLVSCRNLLIYLQPPGQRKALSMFHFSLKSSGTLMLGPSESPGELEDEFQVLEKRWKIYKKRRDIRLPLDTRLSVQLSHDSLAAPIRSPGTVSGTRAAERSMNKIYDQLLEMKMPPSLLVNDNYEIVHIFGSADEYVFRKRGRSSNNVLESINEGLKTALASALQHAMQKQEAVRYNGVKLRHLDAHENVSLVVQPIIEPSTAQRHYLIEIDSKQIQPVVYAETDVDLEQINDERVSSLESELLLTKENLQANIEEMEAANEELQATNEEMVASNEELQSTNEELHSVNEELYTVNAEHQRRVEELARANDDMDNLLATTRVGVIFLDMELGIRRITPEISRLFQMQLHDIGRPIEGFIHHLTAVPLIDDLKAVLRDLREKEIPIEDRSGNPFLLRMTPYRRGDSVEGVVLMLVDISFLRKTQHELVEANRAAKQASKAKSEFLANMSHELRTPMTAMLGFTDILISELENEQHRENLQTIKNNGEYLLTLLNDILDLSKIEAGKLNISRHAVNICDILSDVRELMNIRAKQEGISLDFEYLSQVPCVIMADPTRLRQIMVNLIGNALKFTDEGSVRVLIHMNKTTGQRKLYLNVKDTGIGMTLAQQQELFQPFTRNNHTSARRFGGAGLGLSISKRLADAMGWTIEVESELGAGSQFTLKIPLDEVQSSNLMEPTGIDDNSEHDQTIEMSYPQINGHVLVADDRRDVWRVARYFLEKCGLKVDIAEDGEQAVEMTRRATREDRSYDLIVMDMQMPIMTGPEAIRALRGGGLDIPIIALTADAMHGQREACLEMGCDEYLSKPIDAAQLVHTVAALIKRYRADGMV